jgi:hypothetical protein
MRYRGKARRIFGQGTVLINRGLQHAYRLDELD